MKPTNLILIFGTIIILGIIYLIYKTNKRENIKQAAIASGIPAEIATTASQSTDPERALRSLGVPDDVATLIASGTSITGGVHCVPDCADDSVCIKGACIKKKIS